MYDDPFTMSHDSEKSHTTYKLSTDDTFDSMEELMSSTESLVIQRPPRISKSTLSLKSNSSTFKEYDIFTDSVQEEMLHPFSSETEKYHLRMRKSTMSVRLGSQAKGNPLYARHHSRSNDIEPSISSPRTCSSSSSTFSPTITRERTSQLFDSVDNTSAQTSPATSVGTFAENSSPLQESKLSRTIKKKEKPAALQLQSLRQSHDTSHLPPSPSYSNDLDSPTDPTTGYQSSSSEYSLESLLTGHQARYTSEDSSKNGTKVIPPPTTTTSASESDSPPVSFLSRSLSFSDRNIGLAL
jgi:hypothetical protein